MLSSGSIDSRSGVLDWHRPSLPKSAIARGMSTERGARRYSIAAAAEAQPAQPDRNEKRHARRFEKRKGRSGRGAAYEPERSREGSSRSARRNFHSRSDVRRNFSGVVIDEVSDAVMRDATEVRPISQRADRRLLVFRKNAAAAQADDIGEGAFRIWKGALGVRNRLGFHDPVFRSTRQVATHAITTSHIAAPARL
jgi:hypothetical protein